MQLTKALAVITLLGAAQAAAIPPVNKDDVVPIGGPIGSGKRGQSTDMIDKDGFVGDDVPISPGKRGQSTDMTNNVAWWKREAEKEAKEGEQATDIINKDDVVPDDGYSRGEITKKSNEYLGTRDEWSLAVTAPLAQDEE